jgi:hypothetical protein
MVSRCVFFVLAIGTLAALSLPAGCNSVLGIEEATLKGGGSAGSGSGGSGSSVYVPPPNPYVSSGTCGDPVSSKCSGCLASNCKSGEMTSCLESKDCRAYVLGYSKCLGSSCTPQANKCFEEQLFQVGTPMPTCALACRGDCAETQPASPIASPCQLYCGCMMANCSQKFAPAPAMWASMDACVSDCGTLAPETVNCRWTHCDIAPFDTKLPHCEHAIGNLGVCPDTKGVTRPASTCPDKSLKSFWCDTPDVCCSDDCDLQTKTCN